MIMIIIMIIKIIVNVALCCCSCMVASSSSSQPVWCRRRAVLSWCWSLQSTSCLKCGSAAVRYSSSATTHSTSRRASSGNAPVHCTSVIAPAFSWKLHCQAEKTRPNLCRCVYFIMFFTTEDLKDTCACSWLMSSTILTLIILIIIIEFI